MLDWFHLLRNARDVVEWFFLILRFSQGQTEGQIHKLKRLKRQGLRTSWVPFAEPTSPAGWVGRILAALQAHGGGRTRQGHVAGSSSGT